MPAPTIRLIASYDNATLEQLLAQPTSTIESLVRYLESHPERTHEMNCTGGVGGYGGIGDKRVCVYVFAQRLPFRLFRARCYVFPDELNFLGQLGKSVYLEHRAEKAHSSMARLRKLARGNALVDLTLEYLQVCHPKRYEWLNAGPGYEDPDALYEDAPPSTRPKLKLV